MKTLCVIPARLNSTRLPRKMLAPIGNQPMIQMTYLRAKTCPHLSDVIVATDSLEIAAVIKNIGGTVIMTPEHLPTGSDRVAFVANEYTEFDIIVNLQGDEPLITGTMLSTLLTPYLSGETPVMSTLGYALKFPEEYESPHIVKVILDQMGYGIYFSRSPIPYIRQKGEPLPVLHHMGVYAYQRDFLLKYTKMPQTPLEKTESLEQLRAIENGYKIRVCQTEERTMEVNTPEELEGVRKIVAGFEG